MSLYNPGDAEAIISFLLFDIPMVVFVVLPLGALFGVPAGLTMYRAWRAAGERP